MNAKLPIDVVPNTSPPRFLWRQRVSVPSGYVVQDNEGMLPPNIEDAVAALIDLTKSLMRENAMLRGQAAAQDEQLSKHADAPVRAAGSSSKRGKG